MVDEKNAAKVTSAHHKGIDAKPEHLIPKRSRQARRDLVNLADYYTASLDDDWLGKPGANLAPLLKGVQAFAEAAFDVRGLIQLAGKGPIEETGIEFPKAVKGIKINYKGRKLHFLHGASWSAEEDAKIGEYVLHYADDRAKSIPIVYQRHVKNWWVQEGEARFPQFPSLWSPSSYGHSGGSGAFLWVDPAYDLVAVFLFTKIREKVRPLDLLVDATMAAIIEDL